MSSKKRHEGLAILFTHMGNSRTVRSVLQFVFIKKKNQQGRGRLEKKTFQRFASETVKSKTKEV